MSRTLPFCIAPVLTGLVVLVAHEVHGASVVAGLSGLVVGERSEPKGSEDKAEDEHSNQEPRQSVCKQVRD